jgi:Rrf2 family protein
MDTKFAVAVHALVFISESTDAKTSETISRTLNTNASYVRKILSGLAKAGMITSASKARDCSLLKEPKDILLGDIYEAVEPGVNKLNMSLSQNPDTELFICRCEKPVMENLFKEMENALNEILQSRTLQNIIDDIHKEDR